MSTPAAEDLTAPGSGFAADPHSVFARLREQGPVHRVRILDGREVWLVLGHEHARSALTDPRLRNDIRFSADWTSDGGHAIGVNMLQVDPPRHTRLRGLVAREFTAHRVEALRPRVRRLTGELLDAVLPLGRADLVQALALPLPVTVICELLGVPADDRTAFRAWSAEMVTPSSPEAGAAAAGAMTGYFASLIESKRGAAGDDLLSALVRAQDNAGDDGSDAGLSAEELLGMAFVLLVAGHETTVHLISSGVYALLRDPGQWAALRADPSLAGGTVEEMLRHGCPVLTSAFRFTAEPVEIAGTVIPAGEPVLVVLASAGRDPLRFADPDRFDITRDARGHLSFGHGVHHCLGAPLARLEAEVVLDVLLDRCPDLALDADPADIAWRPGLLRGPERLPVRFTGA